MDPYLEISKGDCRQPTLLEWLGRACVTANPRAADSSWLQTPGLLTNTGKKMKVGFEVHSLAAITVVAIHSTED